MKNINLSFSADVAFNANAPFRVDPDELLEKLLENGYESFHINWCNLFEDDLYIEDDAMFIADAYNEIESAVENGESHEVFLGDGTLQIMTKMSNETARMTVIHTPHLNKKFMQKKEVELTKAQYANAWKSLIIEIVKHAF